MCTVFVCVSCVCVCVGGTWKCQVFKCISDKVTFQISTPSSFNGIL